MIILVITELIKPSLYHVKAFVECFIEALHQQL